MNSFYKALSGMRHDDDFETMKEEVKAFYKAGHIPEFYLATIAQVYQAMQEVKEEREEHRARILKTKRMEESNE